MAKELPKMLYVGDFPAPTGFGIVSRNLIKTFRKHYDLYIVGINYYGDYDPLCNGLKVYPASAGTGDVYGGPKLQELLFTHKPDVVFVLNDVWIAMDYSRIITMYREKNPEAKTKFILYTPIDAENIKEMFLKGIQEYDEVITYTEFGRAQISHAIPAEKLHVVPHGVDHANFHKVDRNKVRKQMGIGPDDFLVLNISRNQPRKRLDLFFYIFAEWVKKYNIPSNVRAYYHGALQDVGIDIIQWCQYLGIENRLALTSMDLSPDKGITDTQMNMVYNSADVFFTTAQAEGWGLPVAEAMAVGLPVIVPRHSALAEWPEDNVLLVDCVKFPILTDRGLNTIHHLIDVDKAVEALQFFYANKDNREDYGKRAEAHMKNKKFDWDRIGAQFMEIIKNGKARN
jgi:glycosyltransferase involved in cell wall biosynthesis